MRTRPTYSRLSPIPVGAPDVFDDRRWPQEHVRPRRGGRPNWGWLNLWEQENPNPGGDHVDFDAWYVEYRRMADRVWVADCLPEFLVWDWSEGDVEAARELVRGHVCVVCGRADDPGCVYGC